MRTVPPQPSSSASPPTPALVNCLTTVICNVSPFCKALCWESSVGLVRLVRRLSRASHFLEAPYHAEDLLFVVEAINNILQYQYQVRGAKGRAARRRRQQTLPRCVVGKGFLQSCRSLQGNQRLVYAILRRKDVFEELDSLTFEEAVRIKEKQRKAALPREQLSRQGGGGASSPRTPVGDSRFNCGEETSPEAAEADAAAASAPWEPTAEWFEEWKAKSRGVLRTPMRLLQHLLPLVSAQLGSA